LKRRCNRKEKIIDDEENVKSKNARVVRNYDVMLLTLSYCRVKNYFLLMTSDDNQISMTFQINSYEKKLGYSLTFKTKVVLTLKWHEVSHIIYGVECRLEESSYNYDHFLLQVSLKE